MRHIFFQKKTILFLFFFFLVCLGFVYKPEKIYAQVQDCFPYTVGGSLYYCSASDYCTSIELIGGTQSCSTFYYDSNCVHNNQMPWDPPLTKTIAQCDVYPKGYQYCDYNQNPGIPFVATDIFGCYSCNGYTGGQCSTRFTCPNDYTGASHSFECTYLCCQPLVCANLTDTSSSCSRNFTCPTGYTGTYADTAMWSSCSITSDAACCSKIQSCNGGATQTSSCAVPNPPANDCGFSTGYYQMTNTTYVHSNCGQGGTSGNGYTCTPSSQCNRNSYSVSCGSTFYNNCNSGAGYTCTNNTVCTTNIYVHVYTDYNHDGVKDGNDAGKSGVIISDGGGNNIATDVNGNVTFTGKAMGTYTISMAVPTNFGPIGGTSHSVSLTTTAGNQTVNFYLTPLYSISGRVFNDLNKDQKYNGNDTGYGGATIGVSGGPTTVANMTSAADGTWVTPTNLESGTYTVTQSSALPAGYQFTTPSSFAVTVGNPVGSPVCNTGGSLDATCGGTNNGSVANLDIGRTNETIWRQSICFDVRNDSGAYTNPIPAAPSCGGVSGAYDSITNADCSTGAGIIFTCDTTPNFGQGSANKNNWQAGGPLATQQECFTGAGLNIIRTSYNYLLTTARESNITPIDMATVCGAGGLANCTLPTNPPLPRGVYLANGPVNLNAFTFPVDPTTPQGFIFLINGDLHLLGNIIVPAGSVAAFSSSGNIYVDPSVGNIITSTSDPANNNPNLEGLYSADANFIVQSYGTGTNICNLDGTPLDKKLNVVGSIVTNAAQGGGSFQDNRDLCIYDTSCPAVSSGDGEGSNAGLAISYWLSLFADGKFLNHKLYNWQELRP